MWKAEELALTLYRASEEISESQAGQSLKCKEAWDAFKTVRQEESIIEQKMRETEEARNDLENYKKEQMRKTEEVRNTIENLKIQKVRKIEESRKEIENTFEQKRRKIEEEARRNIETITSQETRKIEESRNDIANTFEQKRRKTEEEARNDIQKKQAEIESKEKTIAELEKTVEDARTKLKEIDLDELFRSCLNKLKDESHGIPVFIKMIGFLNSNIDMYNDFRTRHNPFCEFDFCKGKSPEDCRKRVHLKTHPDKGEDRDPQRFDYFKTLYDEMPDSAKQEQLICDVKKHTDSIFEILLEKLSSFWNEKQKDILNHVEKVPEHKNILLEAGLTKGKGLFEEIMNYMHRSDFKNVFSRAKDNR